MNEEIELLNERASAYQKLIDLQKQELSLLKQREEYESRISEKADTLASLRSRLAELDADDSLEGRAERNAVADRLSSAQSALSSAQSDRLYELQRAMLSEALAEFKYLVQQQKNAASIVNHFTVSSASDAKKVANVIEEQLYKNGSAWKNSGMALLFGA